MPDTKEIKVTHRFAAAPDQVYEAVQKAVLAEGYAPQTTPTTLRFKAGEGDVTIVVEPEPEAAGTVVTLYDAQDRPDLVVGEQGWQAMLETIANTL